MRQLLIVITCLIVWELAIVSAGFATTVTITEDFKNIDEWDIFEYNVDSFDYSLNDPVYGGMKVENVMHQDYSTPAEVHLFRTLSSPVDGDFTLIFNCSFETTALAAHRLFLWFYQADIFAYVIGGINDPQYQQGARLDINLNGDYTVDDSNFYTTDATTTITRVGNSITFEITTTAGPSYQKTTGYTGAFDTIYFQILSHQNSPFGTQYLNSLSLTYETTDVTPVPEPTSLFLLGVNLLFMIKRQADNH